MIAGFLDLVTAQGETSVAAMMFMKSTLVISAGLLLWFVLRGATASARHLVLGASLIAVFLLPAIASMAPRIPLPILNAQVPTMAATMNIDATTVTAPPVTSEIDEAQSAETPAPVGNSHVLVSLYYMVVLLVLAYLLSGIARVWWLSRRAKDVTPGSDWWGFLQPADTRRVRIALSAELSAPLTWGVVRSVILLPACAEKWSKQDKKNALLHEYAHVERNDWIVQIIANLISAVYWFNPLIWIARRQLVLEAELAADDRVLQSGVLPDDYAAQLVTLTRHSRPVRLPLAATTMAEQSMLSRRVYSILNSGDRKMKLNQLGKSAVITAVAITALLVGSLELVAAPQETESDNTVTIPDSLSTPLIRASANGNHAEVIRLLQSGADVNETSENRGRGHGLQRSALTTAAHLGHLDVVKSLVEAGAPVDRVVRGDATALIAATDNNHFEVTRYLIDAGANPDLAVEGDGSPLISAARANNPDAVRLLLRHGASADLSVSGDENPLYHAARNGNDEIMQMLIDAGVDVNQEWLGDGTALIVATKGGNTEAAETLMLAGARPDQGVRGDGNAMIVAAQRGDTALLQKMIASGADVNAAVKGDGSPLIQAARNGHMDAVAVLLQAGADINQVVAGDENALIGAAWNGDVEMVDYLLRSGADPSIEVRSYGENRTALRQATLEGHDEVVRMLRAAGATE